MTISMQPVPLFWHEPFIMDRSHNPDSKIRSSENDPNDCPHVKLTNKIDELRRATSWLYVAAGQFCLNKSEVERLDFCLNELLTNTICHAYADSETHWIDVFLCQEEGRILLVLEDDGKLFNPVGYDGFQKPESLEDATPNGYGIMMVRSFIDELNYERIGSKNRLTVLLNRTGY